MTFCSILMSVFIEHSNEKVKRVCRASVVLPWSVCLHALCTKTATVYVISRRKNSKSYFLRRVLSPPQTPLPLVHQTSKQYYSTPVRSPPGRLLHARTVAIGSILLTQTKLTGWLYYVSHVVVATDE